MLHWKNSYRTASQPAWPPHPVSLSPWSPLRLMYVSLSTRLCLCSRTDVFYMSAFACQVDFPANMFVQKVYLRKPPQVQVRMKQSGKHSETTLAARRPTFTSREVLMTSYHRIFGKRYSVTSLLAMHTQPQSHRIGSAHRLFHIAHDIEMILRSTVTSGGTL